jgi:hypothetical protein
MDDDRFKQLERLIIDFKESLEREIGDLGNGLRGEMKAGFAAVNERLDRVEATLGRHSGMIVSGTVAIGTITKAVSKQEAAIRDLQARVRKLETRKNGKKSK